MINYAEPIENLIKYFSKFPGIGRRSAEKFALYILRMPKTDAHELASLIEQIKDTIQFCTLCNNFSEKDICHICSDAKRNKSIICVVETPKDVSKVEKTGAYKGVYHVTMGRLSPLDGIGPETLSLNKLVKRINEEKIKEVILALGSSTESEATALFLAKALKTTKVHISRIARGIPIGSALEYADSATLTQSFEDRKAYSK